MSFTTPLPLLIAFLAATLPAQAQLVHLSFESRASTLLLRGDIPDHYAWDTHGAVWAERPVRLDIYYDAALPKAVPDPVVGAYEPVDAGRNFWQLSFADETIAQHFAFTRPLSSLFAYDEGLDCNWGRFDADHSEYFHLALSFLPALAIQGRLPVPPLPAFDPDFGARLELDGSIFDLPGLVEGQLLVQFDSMRAELVPVPEPSTYGIAAAFALGGLVLWRRRSARRLT